MEKKYIDAEEFKNRLEKSTIHFADRISNPAFSIIRNMPAADVAEVVRCKDCAYGKCKHQDMYLCYKDGKDVPPDFHEPEWFCADGQRLE